MAVAKLSTQDRKDLEKYLRYFVYKSAQIIVHSRLGERVSLPSKQFATGADWFNLTVHDDTDVLSKVRRVYPGAGGGLAGGDVVCVETLLQAMTGSAMLLETWMVRLVAPCDSTARVSFTVYSRIGILLKSLLIASRSVPAYRLSRQCSSKACDYSIYYRIYVGEPVLDLGPTFCSQTVGLVPSPVGTVHLSVVYRTQPALELSVASTKDLELRDDHFCVDKSSVATGIASSGWHAISRWQQSAEAETVDRELLSTSPPDHNRMVSIPFDLNQIAEGECGAWGDSKPRTAAFASAADRPTPQHLDSDISAVVPFGQLLEQDVVRKTEKHSTEKVPDKGVKTAGGTEAMTLTSAESGVLDRSKHDVTALDIAARALNTPFAGSTDAAGKEEQEGDLGRFYRECQSAPSLSMFQQPSADVRQLLNSITDQLAQFEANAEEFDEFVNSFQET